MAKGKLGWQRGEGPFAGNKGNKDPIVQADTSDKPFGSKRQLDIDTLEGVGNHKAWGWPRSTGGGANRLPRKT